MNISLKLSQNKLQDIFRKGIKKFVKHFTAECRIFQNVSPKFIVLVIRSQKLSFSNCRLLCEIHTYPVIEFSPSILQMDQSF